MDQQEELVFRTEQTETESQRGTGQISKLLDEKLVSVPGTRRSQELQEFRGGDWGQVKDRHAGTQESGVAEVTGVQEKGRQSASNSKGVVQPRNSH
jgi:hypothetical protein